MAPPKGFKQSAEAREKIRVASLGRRHTIESRAKLSAAHKGKPKGPKTEVQKAAHLKGMQKLRGIKRTDEVRAKISAAVMGHGGYTDEVRQVMSRKAREHAVVNFSGGQEGTKLAELLMPLGFVREHYLYYGEQVVPLGLFAFRRRFIRLDFAHIDSKLNVELDGDYHNEPEQATEDARRDAILVEEGWEVIRVKNGSDFGAEVKALAGRAKLRQFPEENK